MDLVFIIRTFDGGDTHRVDGLAWQSLFYQQSNGLVYVDGYAHIKSNVIIQKANQ